MNRSIRRRLAGPVAALATTVLLVPGAAGAAAKPDKRGKAPRFVSGPVVVGEASVGALLEISTAFTGKPKPVAAFEWNRCDPTGLTCAVIEGACSSSYVVAPADVGSRILSRVQIANSAGSVVAGAPLTDLVASAAPATTPATAPAPGTCISRGPPAPPAHPAPAAQPPATQAVAPRLIAPGAVSPAYLRPFPVVRIRGFAVRRGVRITLLSVAGPRTARIRAICRGRGCPRSTLVPVAAPARLRRLERVLLSGTVLQIRVTAPASIGKYTSFRISAHGAPRRTDRCLLPGRWQPVRCPAG